MSLLLLACNLDKESRVNRDRLDFTTTDESELFFKNVRQPYYELEAVEAAGMNVFRFDDRSLAEDQPVINLAIVHQWRLDEASIFIEPNTFFEEGELTLNWYSASGEQGQLSYARGNREVQQAFVVDLYDHLMA